MPRFYSADQIQQFQAIKLNLDPGAKGGKVIVDSCAQIVTSWVLPNGKVGHNVMYGKYTGAFAGSSAQANSILTALTTGAAWTALAAYIGTAVGLTGVSIRNVSVVDQPLIPSTIGGGNGTSVSTLLPSEVAACLTVRTALAGIANRGRIYLPGFASNALFAGDVILAACVTALNNYGAQIQTAIQSGGNYQMVLGHQERLAYTGSTGTPHAARPSGGIPVTSITCRDNHWDTARRRGLK